MRRAAFLLGAVLLVLSLGAAPARALGALPPLDVSVHFRIMPLGDSITAGTGSSCGQGYRQALADYLTKVGWYSHANYVGSQSSGCVSNPAHEGHSGWRIDDLAGSITGWQATYHPDLILLDAGTNDALQGATETVMASRMTSLLALILANDPGERVIVADLIPTWYGVTSDAASVAAQRFNALLPDIAAAAGPRVVLAHMSWIPSNLTVDGIHPTDAGYTDMAWIWYRCAGAILSSDGVTRAGVDPMPLHLPQSQLCGVT